MLIVLLIVWICDEPIRRWISMTGNDFNPQLVYERPLLCFKLLYMYEVLSFFFGLFMVQQVLVGLCLLFLFPALNPVMNGNLNGSILEINVNLFSFSLTVPQDTGIVTTATLCYLFSNHASAYFLSLYTFYYFIFITDMFLFIHDCCFRHKSHDRCYCPLEMI